MVSIDSDVWVVVPAYNESARLSRSLAKLCESGDYRVVVVDDGSSDDTPAVASRYSACVLRHPINCGQGAALQTGIDFALGRGARFIITFDADGQHSAQDIPNVLAPLTRNEADVVLGSRFLGRTIEMPLVRRCLLLLAIGYTRLTTRLNVTDTHNGFRGFSRRAAEAIRIRQPRMAHASEILEEVARHELSWVECPVEVRYTVETIQKGQTGWDAIRIASQLLVGRWVS